jgi:hypothetical protein
VDGVGEQRTKAIRCGACYYSIVLNAHCVTSMADTDIDAVKKRNNAEHIIVMCIGCIFLTYDMYKSSLRHIHDPVLSSLKMKGIRFFFLIGIIYVRFSVNTAVLLKIQVFWDVMLCHWVNSSLGISCF